MSAALRRGGAAAVPGALAASLLASGCLPAPATDDARAISGLYDIVIVLAVIVAAIVWGLLTFAILRYRRRRPADPTLEDVPPQIGGHIGLEALWTFVPLLTIFGIFGLTVLTLNAIDEPAADGQDAVELHVEAFQWGWRMSYPAAGVTVAGFREPGPEAVVPAGRPLRITLTAVDVIHSFYVPQFLYKRDAVPGRPHQFEMTIEQPGSYAGQCAEYCGLFHARMPFTITAVADEDFEAWLAALAASSSPDASVVPATSGAPSP